MSELRIGLIGTGGIGRTHIERINTKLQGGRVVACADPAADFGMSVAKQFGIQGYENPMALIASPDVDVIVNATADQYHEQFVLAAIAAGKYIFCEKPLAPKADACRRIVDAEIAAGKQLVQVGFMRRYDAGYMQLKEAIQSKKYGEPLLLHCAHRNPDVVDNWDNSSAVENSMIHEIDVLRWLLGENYATAEVRYGKASRHAKAGLHDPQVMVLTTESGVRIDVESYVNNRNNYEIKCEVVCEDAVLNLPEPSSIEVTANGGKGIAIHKDWSTRFVDAYNTEFQAWINACKEGRADGPSAWDGYCGQIAAAAASKARDTQQIVPVEYDPMPDFYKK